jgi:hypothetical protein
MGMSASTLKQYVKNTLQGLELVIFKVNSAEGELQLQILNEEEFRRHSNKQRGILVEAEKTVGEYVR